MYYEITPSYWLQKRQREQRAKVGKWVARIVLAFLAFSILALMVVWADKTTEDELRIPLIGHSTLGTSYNHP